MSATTTAPMARNGKILDAERITLSEPFNGIVRLRKETAERWVRELNTNNRCIKSGNVAYLLGLMESGEFSGDHPEPVVFDENGTMASGQHRCLALIKSSLECIYIRLHCGMPVKLRKHLDRNVPRSIADNVKFVDSPTLNRRVALIINNYYSRQGFLNGTKKLAPSQAEAIFEEHHDSILWTANLWIPQQKGVTRGPVAVALLEFYERDKELAMEFATVLLDKTGEARGCQPARKLREYLLANAGAGGGHYINVELYRKSISCMKAAISGQIITKIYGQTW